MDVLTLLKFWRNTGASDRTGVSDYASSIDDNESFFDLVFDQNDNEVEFAGFQVFTNDENNSSFRFSSPKNTKTPKSPLRAMLLGFQNNKMKPERNLSFEVVEDVKIGAMLTRDNSLRCKLRTEKLLDNNNDQISSKRFSKEVVNKYLNLIKPLKVSKKSNEKSRFSESEKSTTPSSSPASSLFSPKRSGGGGRGAVFREVRKHLGKSRSASAILQTSKSDDSALEQQDGIQGAILHCKRSYNSPSQGILSSIYWILYILKRKKRVLC